MTDKPEEIREQAAKAYHKAMNLLTGHGENNLSWMQVIKKALRITEVVYPAGIHQPVSVGDCFVFDGKEFHKYYVCEENIVELIKKGLYGEEE